jgi:putative FmdB family regulatory protein
VPTYQYACTACGERSEAVQSFTDAPLTECTACGGALRKVFSAVGVVFKGSGFYKTDSRPAAKSGGDSTGSGGSEGGSGGDKTASTTSGSSDAGSSGGSKNAGSKNAQAPAASTSSSSSSTPVSKSA